METNEPKTTEVSEEVEVSPVISYDDFAKLEIKVGTITAVDIVEDADRLLRLTVDVAEDQPRQIVSGIREFFPDPQMLVGKQCPFLTNLAPRKIRGLESQGMILAAGDGDTFALFHPQSAVPAGTEVH